MAEVTPTQQFLGTALAILIVGLFIYALVMFIQWWNGRNKRTASREADLIAPVTYVPVQTQAFNPGVRMSTGMPSMGGVSMGAGGGAGAGMNVGGGGKAGAL